MTRESDDYTEWDAAYLLGALSPNERWEYERHLAECAACSRALAELAGLPALLALVPADQATPAAVKSTDVVEVDLKLTDAAATDTSALAPEQVAVQGAPVSLSWPRLRDAAHAQRRRTRTRRLAAATVLFAAAAVLAVAFVLPGIMGTAGPTEPVAAPAVTLTQVQPSPLSADVRLVSEPWGTRIESTCTYSTAGATDGRSARATPVPTSAPGRAYGSGEQGYAMYVTDRAGASSVVASWVAAPGSTVEPVGTTQVPAGDIASVDIRSVETGQVLLATHLGQ